MTPIIEDICSEHPEPVVFDDMYLRSRKIRECGMLYTCYGIHIVEYILHSLGLRTSDTLSYSNMVNEKLFERLFGSKFNFTFNSRIKIEKDLLIEKLEAMIEQGYDLRAFVSDYKNNKRKYLSYEIDVSMMAKTADPHPLLFETKIFTCPNQGSSILQKYFQPQFLNDVFLVRDYLGLITFSSIVEKSRPNRIFRFPSEVPKQKTTNWFIHVLIFDRRLQIKEDGAAKFADEMLMEIRQDQDFFLEWLGLNEVFATLTY